MVAPARRHLVSANRPTLANGGVTVFVRANRTGNGANGVGRQSPADAFDFFRTQFTSTLANQDSVLVIHAFLLSSFRSVERPYLFKRNFIGGRATDENAGRRRGRPAMKLALAEEGVAVPLAQTIDRAECGGT